MPNANARRFEVSGANVGFSASLGCPDEVPAYDALGAMDRGWTARWVPATA